MFIPVYQFCPAGTAPGSRGTNCTGSKAQHKLSMKKHSFIYILLALHLLIPVIPAAAQMPEARQCEGWRNRQWADENGHPPFGGYCQRRHSDRYGARQPIKSWHEAQERLIHFFNIHPSHIILRKERGMGYIVDITKPDGTLSDRVLIDKRTGRIKSIR